MGVIRNQRSKIHRMKFPVAVIHQGDFMGAKRLLVVIVRREIYFPINQHLLQLPRAHVRVVQRAFLSRIWCQFGQNTVNKYSGVIMMTMASQSALILNILLSTANHFFGWHKYWTSFMVGNVPWCGTDNTEIRIHCKIVLLLLAYCTTNCITHRLFPTFWGEIILGMWLFTFLL